MKMSECFCPDLMQWGANGVLPEPELGSGVLCDVQQEVHFTDKAPQSRPSLSMMVTFTRMRFADNQQYEVTRSMCLFSYPILSQVMTSPCAVIIYSVVTRKESFRSNLSEVLACKLLILMDASVSLSLLSRIRIVM